MLDIPLFKEGVAHSPHQPATCLFRGVELGHLLQEGFLPTEGKLLDLGCGDGWILSMLRARLGATWKITGIDPDAREVELARQTGIYSELSATTGDKLPCESGTQDIVFSNSVLEHIPDVKPVLADASRVLRQDGRFVITVPSSHFTAMLRDTTMLGRFVSRCKGRDAYIAYMDRRLAHRYYWTLDTWKTELEKVGLRVEKHYFYLSTKELNRWETLSHLTAGMVGRLFSSDKHPIELQHQLGIRKGKSSTVINMIGRLLGFFGLFGLPKNTPVSMSHGSCLAICARKL